MTSDLISVITTCYNKAPYLNEAINSVLNQSYQNFELIIINDGSTDDSEKIILSKKDSRIKYFRFPNQGQAASSNYALSIAKGKYIKFLDADDIMNTEHLTEQIQLMDNREDLLVSCSWGRFHNGDINTALFEPESVWQDMSNILWIKSALSQKSDMMAVWLWLIPASIINKVGGWNLRDSMNNDFEFSMRLLLNVTHVKFAVNAKMYYRSGINSMSVTKSVKEFRKAIYSNELGCEHLLAFEDSSQTRKLCADRLQEWLFRIYPMDRVLERELELKIKKLGGSSRKFESGFFFTLFRKSFGWKIAKKLKLIFLEYKSD
jgi:glycosyltransferase involved in cell wall biosynthesis